MLRPDGRQPVPQARQVSAEVIGLEIGLPTASDVPDIVGDDGIDGRQQLIDGVDPPSEPSFYAFSFTRASERTAPSFVIAGGAEARGGSEPYPERIVRYRDLSPEGVKEKVRFTTREMEDRMDALGFVWKDTTGVQAYSVHDFHHALAEELVRRGAARSGLTWHFARPPVIDLEFEMDCRRVLREVVI